MAGQRDVADLPARFQKMTPSSINARVRPTTRTFEDIEVDGKDVRLRVFVPEKSEDTERPAVVMVCGLGWFGEGLLGAIGLKFNDAFGYAFAKAGVPCVQIHTPQRHIGYTRVMDLMAVMLFPLTLPPTPLRALACILDVFMISSHAVDLLPLAAMVMLLPYWGPWALPCAHLATRNLQYLRGVVPGPKRRDTQKEIAATVAWAQDKENQKKLGSDGRLVLCGYSSGAHCASLYGLSEKAAKFEAVVLISGMYNLQTDLWSGLRRWLKPLFDVVYGDIHGCYTAAERRQLSPEAVVERKLDGQEWYLTNAKTELLGIQPFQDILFQADPFCKALTAKGAKVHRVLCGHNHWLLALKMSEFIVPFCQGLLKKS